MKANDTFLAVKRMADELFAGKPFLMFFLCLSVEVLIFCTLLLIPATYFLHHTDKMLLTDCIKYAPNDASTI